MMGAGDDVKLMQTALCEEIESPERIKESRKRSKPQNGPNTLDK
jgi:hypothetical protein